MTRLKGLATASCLYQARRVANTIWQLRELFLEHIGHVLGHPDLVDKEDDSLPPPLPEM